jgi:hypothetical protein
MEKADSKHSADDGSDHLDSEYDESKEEEEDDDNFLKEMIAIAQNEDRIGLLTEIEIIFTPIRSLENAKLCHNLIQLIFIKTQTKSIEGIECCGHSLEILIMIGWGLEIMENSFAYLTNLREINLAENNIPCIQNIDNCLHLEKLFLYSNKISSIGGLSNNKKLKELHLQDNLISKITWCDQLPNLQILFLSGNRIKNLNDLKDIENLPQIKKLSFAWENFDPWPVFEISGYRQYVLSVWAQSPYLQVLDSELISEEDLSYAKNEFIECVLELQKSLEEVEKSHRRSVLTIDSKLRVNEQQLEDIEDTLIDELNSLRQDIEEGKTKLLNEFEKLKKLRSKSEETFLKSLKEIEDKYESVLDQALANEEEKMLIWEKLGDKSVKAWEFEKEVYLTLLDVLYTTKGRVIYSEIINSSSEFSFLSSMVNKITQNELSWKLVKAFHVNFSDLEFSEQLLGPRTFVSLSLQELKEFLMERKLPQFKSSLWDEKFPGEIDIKEGNSIVITLRAEK